jgi:hypothetical protein
MYNTLSHHKTNIILVPEQFGFRKDMSTEDAAFKLTYNVLKPTNKKKCMLEEYSVILQKLLTV